VQPHRDGGQAQYIQTPMPAVPAAEPIADTLAWMTAHLAEQTTIAELAARAMMSRRSFARHFAATTGSTPYQWLLRQRIQYAQRLLERTELAVDVVADRVGLGNATNLRKHFRRLLDTSPQAYRRAFRGPEPAR
jgi:transcriptional regulator GlxA family with amidase domain